MTTILELATVDPMTLTPIPSGTLPAVTYDREGRMIFATVVISPTSNPNKYDHQIPPICIPGLATNLSWTVIWNLVPVGGLSAVFPSDPIAIPRLPLPLGIGFSGLTTLLPPTQCLAQISNNVTQPEFFKYELLISVTNSEGTPIHPGFNPDRIDPTIVVTPDPIDS